MTSWMWTMLAFPSWKATFVWRFHRADDNSNNGFGVVPSFLQKSIYVGLANNPAIRPYQGWSRPSIFIGARFDTDPGVTLTLTSVNAASGGTTGYNGTISTLNNNLVGATFTVTGFTNSANNGVFLSTANTTTTLTLVNNNAVPTPHTPTP